MAFDRYMNTKYNLRETTRSNYMYMFNKFVRDEFGNKLLSDVKYMDVKMFYYHLLNEKNIAINTLDMIQTKLHPIFTMVVRDDIIRKNPTDGVMAEIKKNSGKNKGIRHALTLAQQQAFINEAKREHREPVIIPKFSANHGTKKRGNYVGYLYQSVIYKQQNALDELSKRINFI